MLHWQQEDEKILTSINALVEDIKRNPSRDLVKPEPRHTTRCGLFVAAYLGEHRLVFRVLGQGRRSADRHRAVPVSLLRWAFRTRALSTYEIATRHG